jgi:hypothetical protein
LIDAQIENDVPASGVAAARRANPQAASAVEKSANSSALENAFKSTKF